MATLNTAPVLTAQPHEKSVGLVEGRQAPAPKFVILEDKNTSFTDYLSEQYPVHYYGFVALRGQYVVLTYPNGDPLKENWKVERYSDCEWIAHNAESKVFTGLEPGAEIIIRAMPRELVGKHDLSYAITFGSYPVLKRYDLLDEPRVLRIPSGHTVPEWLATQVYKEAVLEVEFTDTKNAPLQGGVAALELSFGKGEMSVTRVLVSDANGHASALIELGRCYGGHEAKDFVDKNKGFNTWKNWYRAGGYHVRNISLGVTAPKPHICYIGHICTQRVQKTVAPRG